MLVKQSISTSSWTLAQVPLGKGFFAIVDPEDLTWLVNYRWFVRKSHKIWYAMRKYRINGKEHITRMHRQIMACPDDMQVHHINGQTLDNRKENLSIIEPRLHAALRITRLTGLASIPPGYEVSKKIS